MNLDIIHIIYLFASVTFILGLKMLSNPKTARNGNILAAAGMIVAILGTIFLHEGEVNSLIYGLIFGAIGLGTLVGWLTAKRVQMTKMPELVSLFNGMGGACAALIGLVEFHHNLDNPTNIAIILAGMVIGSVSFSGSIIAWAKLNGSLKNAIRLPKYNILNTLILIGLFAYSAFIVWSGTRNEAHLYGLFTAAILYGILFVIPIGGADMPVVISLLNSFTGLAAAFGGFLYGNQVMLTGGILVGSAGTLLTLVMCEAMNRPLFNVIFGAFGEGETQQSSGNGSQGTIKEVGPSDLAVQMNYSNKILIVPGYGLAVAQAQHVIKELEQLLEDRGVEVAYAIHPVAGRMPGHMNVLLAESNVDYDKLKEMEDVNPEFSQTDLVLVVGANDVVNPAAKTDPTSPIFGMPILEVENAKHVVVNKRSMNAGYAGIQNELFFRDKTSMLFGDAKKVLTELVNELKALD
ncbi:MAG: NAD(P)(+) transhydrogenase (Re/Si-specific) subunit beta [Bacteroidia bacterium]|nr:NAD(P)(+) transhydrogenase (Re/Si-specific) subunit beta [Bacteroidia bacterium]MDG2041663.1 NAD(P)(+) transhydrogenase (Re/Si-specific) subunit beta [Bacteroidia bacterium]|tara:strand:+ start:13348 stop:14736 length:1389 start_codon:yes stop_codon:yes gene_type:complete